MQETERLVLYKYLLFFLFFIHLTPAYPQVYPDGKVDSLLRAAISCIIEQDYSGAELYIKKLGDEFPELPLARIYFAAVKIAEAYDYAEEFDDDFISHNLEEAKEQSEELIESDQKNIWYRYFYALSEGYIAYFDAIKESWLSAISTGINSISEFEKILSMDKNFYEAYIAIGTFEYWKSRKTEFMSWVPFVNDTKKLELTD